MNKNLYIIKFTRLYLYFLLFFLSFFSPLILNYNAFFLIGIQLIVLIMLILYEKKIDNVLLFLFVCLMTFYIIQISWALITNGANLSLLRRFHGVFAYYIFLLASISLFYKFLNINNYKSNWNLQKFFVGCLNIVAVYCIIEYFLKYNPLFSGFFSEIYHDYYSIKQNTIFYRVSGSMQHPIVMGNFLLINLFFNLGLSNRYKKNRYIVYSLINLVALLLTFSRGIYVSIVVIFAIDFFINIFLRNSKTTTLNKIGRIFILVISFILIFVIASKIDIKSIIYSRFAQLNMGSGSASLYQRLYGFFYVMDKMGNSNLFNYLFGYGFGSLAYTLRVNNISLFLMDFYTIDNQYLTIFYELGLLGVISFISITQYFIIKNVYKIIKYDLQELKYFVLSLEGFLINILFYDGLSWPNIIIVVSYIFGWILYLNYMNKNVGFQK